MMGIETASIPNNYLFIGKTTRILAELLANNPAQSIIGFHLIDSKILYAESEMEDLFRFNYRPPFN